MTPQVLHAMFRSGWLTVGSERLNVSPKTTEEIISWLQQEEGLTECTFEQLDLATQYSLLSHNSTALQWGCRSGIFVITAFSACRAGKKQNFCILHLSGRALPITSRLHCMSTGIRRRRKRGSSAAIPPS